MCVHGEMTPLFYDRARSKHHWRQGQLYARSEATEHFLQSSRGGQALQMSDLQPTENRLAEKARQVVWQPCRGFRRVASRYFDRRFQ